MEALHHEKLEAIAGSLHRLEWMLGSFILLCVLLVITAVSIFCVTSRRFTPRRAGFSELIFRERAKELFDSGQDDALIQYAMRFHEHYPYNLYVVHYLALAYRRIEDLPKAREYFERIKHVYPPWTDYAEEMLDQLRKDS